MKIPSVGGTARTSVVVSSVESVVPQWEFTSKFLYLGPYTPSEVGPDRHTQVSRLPRLNYVGIRSWHAVCGSVSASRHK